MGSVNLDNTGSGSAITLSSDGTSLLLNGTAIGGGGGDPDLYRDNASSAVTPTASGTNAVAIGSGAVASGTFSFAFGSSGSNAAISSGSQSISMGSYSRAYGSTSIAMGYAAEASSGASGGVALGQNSRSAGNYAVGLPYSRASGTDSFAAAISTNSSSYGASGANSIAIGYRAKATQANSIAIGDTATSTTANQIALGGTTDTVKISGTYTLPTTDGTNGQVLTTDGSGAVTFADAGGGGGADLYAANESSPSAQPSATGVNAIAIGDDSLASGLRGMAVGYSSTASGQDSAALGNATASGESSAAVGFYAIASGAGAVSIGYGANASGTFAGCLGFNGKATANSSIALGNSYASGEDSLAAVIDNNTSSYGATGTNSIAGGVYNKATATGSLCWGGDSNVAQSGAKSAVVGGWLNNCSGAYSFISGGRGNKITSGSYSRAGGLQADVNGTGIDTWSSGRFSSDGDAQTSKRVLIANTTDATATVLGTQNINSLAANQVTLPNNSAYAFHGTIVARQQAADGTACAAWKVEGLIRREGSAGTTVLVNSATTVLDNTPNWGMALSADTTNGCLKIQATGAASTDIRWVATIHTSEVTYA